LLPWGFPLSKCARRSDSYPLKEVEFVERLNFPILRLGAAASYVAELKLSP